MIAPLLSDPAVYALIAAGSAIFGGGTVAAIVVKLLSRDGDQAEAGAKRSASKKDDLDVLRGVIDELRDSEARKNERINQLEARMTQLEERERHALTRAAVHEAWDQLAFATLVAHNPQHPPPPPLTLAKREHDERVRDEQDARDDRDAQAARDDRDAASWRADRDARREDHR